MPAKSGIISGISPSIVGSENLKDAIITSGDEKIPLEYTPTPTSSSLIVDAMSHGIGPKNGDARVYIQNIEEVTSFNPGVYGVKVTKYGFELHSINKIHEAALSSGNEVPLSTLLENMQSIYDGEVVVTSGKDPVFYDFGGLKNIIDALLAKNALKK